MSRDGDALVFSTERNVGDPCPTCGQRPCVCAPAVEVVPAETVLRLRLESKGRKGKRVTVLFDLPHNPPYVAGLLQALKAHCGTGGALKDGHVELQGDQRDKAQVWLERQGFTVRRSGGG